MPVRIGERRQALLGELDVADRRAVAGEDRRQILAGQAGAADVEDEGKARVVDRRDERRCLVMIDEAVATALSNRNESRSPRPQLTMLTGHGHERSLSRAIVPSYQAEPGSTVVMEPQPALAGAPMNRNL